MRDSAATPIVPRWEWRAFARYLGAAGDCPAALPRTACTRTTSSDCSREGPDAVKVCDGLMDVKHLERVDEQGLERWMPTMKATFPLSAADIRAAW